MSEQATPWPRGGRGIDAEPLVLVPQFEALGWRPVFGYRISLGVIDTVSHFSIIEREFDYEAHGRSWPIQRFSGPAPEAEYDAEMWDYYAHPNGFSDDTKGFLQDIAVTMERYAYGYEVVTFLRYSGFEEFVGLDYEAAYELRQFYAWVKKLRKRFGEEFDEALFCAVVDENPGYHTVTIEGIYRSRASRLDN